MFLENLRLTHLINESVPRLLQEPKIHYLLKNIQLHLSPRYMIQSPTIAINFITTTTSSYLCQLPSILVSSISPLKFFTLFLFTSLLTD